MRSSLPLRVPRTSSSSGKASILERDGRKAVEETWRGPREPLKSSKSGRGWCRRSIRCPARHSFHGIEMAFPSFRQVVVKCLEEMDSQEQPEKPGMLLKSTLEHTVERFDEVFNCRVNRQEEVR